MNDVVVRSAGFGLINREDLAKGLGNAAMSIPVAGANSFLKMDKSNGDWLFGQEETVVEPDSLWAVNPMSLKHGWVAWDTNGGGAPVQEIMVSALSRPLPAKESLPPLGMGSPDKKGNSYQLEYQKQFSVELTCVSGEDENVTVEYKQSSVGAAKLFGTLIAAIYDQATKGDEIIAIGNLTFDKYKHKQYGWIHNPIFKIVEWRTPDDTAPVEDKPEPVKEEPAARTRTRAAAAPAPEAEQQDDDEAENLAKEYATTQAANASGGDATAPRRRQRR